MKKNCCDMKYFVSFEDEPIGFTDSLDKAKEWAIRESKDVSTTTYIFLNNKNLTTFAPDILETYTNGKLSA